MSIRPIDMQVMLNNTANINKINNTTQQHNEAQLMFDQQFKETVERDNERTIETNKSEEERIKDEHKKKNQQQEKNKKEKNKNTDIPAEPIKRNKSSSMFDVSI